MDECASCGALETDREKGLFVYPAFRLYEVVFIFWRFIAGFWSPLARGSSRIWVKPEKRVFPI